MKVQLISTKSLKREKTFLVGKPGIPGKINVTHLNNLFFVVAKKAGEKI